MKEQILFYALKYDGEYHKIAKALKNNDTWEKVDCPYPFVTCFDEEYPAKLRRLEKFPWILFYKGNLDLMQKKACGIIGSRLASQKGLERCQHVTNIIKAKNVVVSGMAKGIDACAHQCALDHETIGVIGCGIDVVYPKENQRLYQQMEKNQLIISEYPPGCKPYAYHFPWRNRIIAALSDAIVVIEAKKRSGTLLTVNEAINIDVPVYCLPHDYLDVQGTGCNILISQGAYIIVDDEDIRSI